MGRNPFLPLGWPDKLKECEGDEDCNSVYRSILHCLGLEGLEQLRKYNLSSEVATRCGVVLANLIDSRPDMTDLALEFIIAMNHIDNVLAEPTDAVSATRRLLNAIKTLIAYVDKARSDGDTKTEEFVLDALIAGIFGTIKQYLDERGSDPFIRSRLTKLLNILTEMIGTKQPTTQNATPDWW